MKLIKCDFCNQDCKDFSWQIMAFKNSLPDYVAKDHKRFEDLCESCFSKITSFVEDLKNEPNN